MILTVIQVIIRVCGDVVPPIIHTQWDEGPSFTAVFLSFVVFFRSSPLLSFSSSFVFLRPSPLLSFFLPLPSFLALLSRGNLVLTPIHDFEMLT